MNYLRPSVVLAGLAASSLTGYILINGDSPNNHEIDLPRYSSSTTEVIHKNIAIPEQDATPTKLIKGDKHEDRVIPNTSVAHKPSASKKVSLISIPESKFKKDLAKLSVEHKQRALKTLADLGQEIVNNDIQSLNVDETGGVFYTCSLKGHNHHNHVEVDTHHRIESSNKNTTTTAASEAVYDELIDSSFNPSQSVSISKVPAFHSRKGASKKIFLDFNGGIVENTQWNTSRDKPSWDCKAYSIDTDFSTFSEKEQRVIHEIWMRVSEDFASFDVDVTTEDPGAITDNVAWAMITPTKDKNDQDCPHTGYGGLAYVNVFGTSYNARYAPAWILSGSSSYVASSISHEVGHNLGLGHDGKGDKEYYSGHNATDDFLWAPIMGGGQAVNIAQWSNGSYFEATNSQDDLAVLSGKLGYLADDQSNSTNEAKTLISNSQERVTQTARIERSDDIDVFKIECNSGNVSINVDPFSINASDLSWRGELGSNLFVSVELQNGSGTQIAAQTPELGKAVSISKSLEAGTYYLVVKPRAIGNPKADPATGFDTYGSIGTYTVTVKTENSTGTTNGGGDTVVDNGGGTSDTNDNNGSGNTNDNSSNGSDSITVDIADTTFNYDLGTSSSPVMSGWTRISPQTTGDISWSKNVDSRDRGAMDGINSINRDFCFSSDAVTLNMKVSDGSWKVVINMGDATASHDKMMVKAEGVTQKTNISNNPKEFPYITFDTLVLDGKLSLKFSDKGGNDSNWVVSRISLEKNADPTSRFTGKKITLKALSNNKFVCADKHKDADPTANNTLLANRTSAGLWETFKVIDVGNGFIALKASSNNKFIRVTTERLIADRTAQGDADRFKLIQNSDNTYSLFSKSLNRYVCTDELLNKDQWPLAANRLKVSQWEKFKIEIK